MIIYPISYAINRHYVNDLRQVIDLKTPPKRDEFTIFIKISGGNGQILAKKAFDKHIGFSSIDLSLRISVL